VKKKAFILSMVFISFAVPAFASSKEDVKKANVLYNKKKYQEARKAYEEAVSKSPDSARACFGLGDSLYRQSSYAAAIENYNKTIASGKDKFVQASDYNIGNAQYRLATAARTDFAKAKESLETALQFYKRAIDLDANDRDAKFNYEFVANKLKQLKENKNKEKKEEDKQDEKKQQQQKDKENKPRQQGSQGDGSGQPEKDKSQKNESGQDKPGESKDQKSQEEKNQKQKEGSGEKENNAEDKGTSGSEQKEEENQKAGAGETEKSEEGRQEPAEKENQEKTGEEQKQQPSGGEKKKPGKSEEKAGQEGLQAYQSPGSEGEGREMSEQEAKMMLEGYKGEEATGRAVRMRKKRIDLPEPLRDW
jgi:Ca-activated chloride channel homolog